MTTNEKLKQGSNDYNKPIKTVEIETIYLSEKNFYAKCPICVKEKKRFGFTKDKIIAETKSCVKKKVKELYKGKDGTYNKAVEEYYICPECKARLTVNDFEKAYCKPYDPMEEQEDVI